VVVRFDQKSPFGEAKNPFGQAKNPYAGRQVSPMQQSPQRSADVNPMRRDSSPATPMPGQVNKKDPNYGVMTDLEKEKLAEAEQNRIADSQVDPMQQFQQFLASIDPGDYDYEGAVRDAFAKSYAALDNAANTARGNKEKSAQAVQGLAQSGSNLVRNDAGKLTQITNDATGAINNIYTGQVGALQNDRSKELADRAAFLKANGIQEAGIGSAGSTQTEAINEALGANTREQARMQGYGQADQALNNDRAQSMLNEGTLRQADLERQLTAILGNLDSKRAEVGGQEAQALAQAKQQAYENAMAKFSAGQQAYDKQIDRGYKDQDQQLKMMEFLAKYGPDGQGNQQTLSPTGNQAADAYVQQQGQNVDAYRNFMSKFMMELQNDPNVRMNNVNENMIISQMMKQGADSGLDPNIIANMYQLQKDAPIRYMK
jgi:hypothetical protein